VVVALPLLLDALDVHDSGGGWTGFGKDAVVMVEAVVLNGALNQVVKLAAQRPRPLLYDAAPGSPELDQADNYLSFYSSHTSTAFAAGMSYASTFAARHPDSGYRYLVYGGAVVAGGTVGTLRMLAGKHFPTDVLTGALAGTAIGLAVPWMHRRSPSSIAVYPFGAGVSLVGTF
jgi:membrane-associated phospholipid phosphatase